jgi:hypothetical protein
MRCLRGFPSGVGAVIDRKLWGEMIMPAVCHFCQKPVDLSVPIGERDHCESCKSDLHCCRNCKFHDPGYPNECRETFSPFIRDREAFNFCHYFQFIVTEDDNDADLLKAKSALNTLFGPKGDSAPTKPDLKKELEERLAKGALKKADESRSKLDSMFQKTKEEEYLDRLDDYAEGKRFAEKRLEEREKAPSESLKKLNDLFKK